MLLPCVASKQLETKPCAAVLTVIGYLASLAWPCFTSGKKRELIHFVRTARIIFVLGRSGCSVLPFRWIGVADLARQKASFLAFALFLSFFHWQIYTFRHISI
ncbi:unnamed protein product [Ixodes persulcatus]